MRTDWSKQEKILLKEIFPCNHKKVIMGHFPGRSWNSIRARSERLNLIRDPVLIHEDRIDRKPRCDGFQPEEDALLKDIYEHNSRAFIQKKFPHKKWNIIRHRALFLSLKRTKDVISVDRTIRGPRKDAWTPEEENLLKEIFVNNSKEFIIEKFKSTFTRPRSWQSIFINAKGLRLYRNPEIIKQEMIAGGKTAPPREDFWSPEEDLLLREIYEHNSQNYIKGKFPGRTWKAIREHCIRLGLRRDKELYFKESHENSKVTMQARYGVDYSTQLPSMQEKSRQTNLKERGVEYPMQSPEVQELSRKTVQERYGVDNVFQNEDIQRRSKEALYKHGTQICSKQQAHIANLLKGKINFPVGNCSIDVLIDNFLACEYDGGGHLLQIRFKSLSEKDFFHAERKRDLFLKSKGYSIIRIVSKKDKLPSDTVLIEMVSYSKEYLSKGHSWITFNIDENKLICKEFQKHYDFGPLRNIN